jgi:hypothetical protein
MILLRVASAVLIHLPVHREASRWRAATVQYFESNHSGNEPTEANDYGNVYNYRSFLPVI